MLILYVVRVIYMLGYGGEAAVKSVHIFNTVHIICRRYCVKVSLEQSGESVCMYYDFYTTKYVLHSLTTPDLQCRNFFLHNASFDIMFENIQSTLRADMLFISSRLNNYLLIIWVKFSTITKKMYCVYDMVCYVICH